ncbi:hypothetical protein BGX23_003139 [Mortierella sp. AD031]|nr:hypothetical protein BGX23_003139 [Mortierella sp. AD031]
MLQDALNSSGSSVLFFVVTPRNGRVAPDDFAVMKTLLMNLKRGPMVGLIITQVKRRQMAALYNDEFYSNFLEVLQAVDADTTFFEQHRWLILEEHEEDFDDDDRRAIRDYVFSFTPETVKVQSLIASIFQRILDFSKGISGVLDNA